ncbi:hypothetical protein PG996_006346 [Apiospora saccharicola]|uniref:Uncharacterized protein n=1 Tax=Apiospora saccharicola TaxID=335842 RepID=A0ABR1VP66_9PEZI
MDNGREIALLQRVSPPPQVASPALEAVESRWAGTRPVTPSLSKLDSYQVSLAFLAGALA